MRRIKMLEYALRMERSVVHPACLATPEANRVLRLQLKAAHVFHVTSRAQQIRRPESAVFPEGRGSEPQGGEQRQWVTPERRYSKLAFSAFPPRNRFNLQTLRSPMVGYPMVRPQLGPPVDPCRGQGQCGAQTPPRLRDSENHHQVATRKVEREVVII